jgi:hypothetical protein
MRQIDRYVGAVAAVTTGVLGESLLSLSLVGSLATDDARGPTSDVDMLTVLAEEPPAGWEQRLGEAVLEVPCPWAGIEYVVYDAEVLRTPRLPLPYRLNVNGGPTRARAIRTSGDPAHWFLLDVAIAAEHSVALLGPPASALIGPVPDGEVRAALDASLAWHAEHDARAPNAVLNACRGWAWLHDRRWRAKTPAGRWVLGRAAGGDPTARRHRPLVEQALARRLGADAHPPADLDPAEVARLLADVRRISGLDRR